MRRHQDPTIPATLLEQVDTSLMLLDRARAELARAVAAGAPLRDRRAAHAQVRRAYDEADAQLRRATATAKQHSRREWTLWRHRLSSLDTARQIHLLAEQDEGGLLPLGGERAVDTGMSGPDIGDLQHGRSRAPGSLPTYGLDLEALLLAPTGTGSETADPPGNPDERAPTQPAAVVPPHAERSGPPGTSRQAA